MRRQHRIDTTLKVAPQRAMTANDELVLQQLQEQMHAESAQRRPHARAKLSCGSDRDCTFVEMWGMPKDPAYAEKMRGDDS